MPQQMDQFVFSAIPAKEKAPQLITAFSFDSIQQVCQKNLLILGIPLRTYYYEGDEILN